MEYERNFSIQPYIECAGILGKYIDVNRVASTAIMHDTAIKSDVWVTRRNADSSSYQSQGSDVLTLLKSNFPVFDTCKSPRSSYRLMREGWEVSIFDQEINRDVDSWMGKNYTFDSELSGNEVYAKRFVQVLSQEVSYGIGRAAGQEKKDHLRKTLKIAAKNDAKLMGGIFVAGLAGKWLVDSSLSLFVNNYSSDTLAEWLKMGKFFGSLLVSSVGIATVWDGLENAENDRNESEISAWETVLPNFQLRSWVEGSRAIQKYKEQLIELK